MKQIFKLLAFLLFSQFAVGQLAPPPTGLNDIRFVIPGTYNKGWPSTFQAGTSIPTRVQMADEIKTALATPGNKKKYPLIILHPGCGEKTNAQSDRTNLNTSELGELSNTTPFSLLNNSSGALWNKTYRLPDGTFTPVIWAGVQLWGPVGSVNCSGGTGGYTYTYPYMSYYSIKFFTEYWSNIVDTTRIYLAGLSQGGGHCAIAIQDSIICSKVAAALIIATGYNSYSGFAPTGRTNSGDNQNWDDVAASGLPIWWFHAENDATTGGSSANSRNSVVAINSRNPLFLSKFYEYESNSHTIGYNVAFTPSLWNTNYTMSDGTIKNLADQDPISWLLQFTKNPSKSRRPDGK